MFGIGTRDLGRFTHNGSFTRIEFTITSELIFKAGTQVL